MYNKLALRTKQLILATINLFICVFFLLILSLLNVSYQNWLSTFALIIVVTFIINLKFIRTCKFKLLSFFVIFITLLYVFHFGQVVVFGFFPSYKATGYNFIQNGTDSIKKSLLYSYIVINSIISGGLITQINIKNESIISVSRSHYKLIAFALLIISLPLQIIYLLKTVSISHESGYGESLHAGFSGAYVQIATFYLIAFVMILVLYKDNLKLRRIIFIAEMLFLVINMLSGSRIYTIAAGLVLCTVYFSTGKKLKFSQLILLIILAFIFLQFIVAIAKVREQPNFGLSAIINYMFDFKNNALLMILEELGSSIASVYITIEQVPDYQTFAYGITYLKSLAGVLINLPGLDINGIVDSACYIKQLEGTLSFGGSLIGELYFNFGYILSVPIAFLIGYVGGLISRKAAGLLNRELNLNLPLIIMVMYTHIIWVRGYFSNIVRAVVWAALLLFVLYKVVGLMFVKHYTISHNRSSK